MRLENFLQKIDSQADAINFSDTMDLIDALYSFTPTAFKNGGLQNAAGQNNGSCKLFAFARLHKLSERQTLVCFGQYYRDDVLKNPQGNDHQNIRNFMNSGWSGIEFDAMPLTPIND